MRIAIWAGSGIGGTEKAASIFAVQLARRGYAVDYLTPSKGARADYLASAGVQIWEGQHESSAFEKYLQEGRPNVIHQHVPGYPIPNPIYSALARMAGRRPALIESNIFGRFEEPMSDSAVRHRMFVSRTSAVQAFRRGNRVLDHSSASHCTVLNNPLLPLPSFERSIRETQRAELGIREDEVLALRVGQPGPGKWTKWEAEAYCMARKGAPNLRLVLMEPPAKMQSELLARGKGEGITVLPATANFDRLNGIYAASDVMIHATYFGESFGYTIAEAMQAGLPVIARSTPWGDNAQVELVDNGRTGFVCATVPEMARRLQDIAQSDTLRRRMADEGRRRIEKLTDAALETDVLEAVFRLVINGERDQVLDQRREELLAYARDFSAREHRFSESFLGRPREWLNWQCYKKYRLMRTAARRLIRAFRSRSQRRVVRRLMGE